MTTELGTPHRSQLTSERESFWHPLHAEWTKFRTVRGWVIAVGVTIVAITAFVFVASDVSSSCVGSGGPSACPVQPTGPGGVPVLDAFYFGHQPVTGSGTITVQMTSLTGQAEVGQAGNGAPQLVSAAAPRWLRLVRDGGTITGYDSADGTHWTLVGTATLPGLTSTVQAGLFAAGSRR